MFKAHSKTSLEFLHLETGTKPIRFIIASRRLNYLQNILQKPRNELIRRVYEAQKKKPAKGAWIELVKKDLDLIGEELDEESISAISKNKFKRYVKKKMDIAVFDYLEGQKAKHSKVKDIKYVKLETQPYIVSENLTNVEMCTLFALRSRMTKVKKNFSNQFFNNLHCKLGCSDTDSQEHLLECRYIQDKLKDKSRLAEAEYSDLFGTVKQQCDIVKIFSEILEIRETLTETQQ